MKCVTTPTTSIGPCVPCKHPLEYLVEKAYLISSIGKYNQRISFQEALSNILLNGMVFPSCGYCCPDCEGVYYLGSVEQFVCGGENEQIQQCLLTGGKFANLVGLVENAASASPNLNGNILLNSPFDNRNNYQCCSNVYANIDTKLLYDTGMGLTSTQVVPALPNVGSGAQLEGGDFNPYIKQCCNGFDECVDDLICWVTENSRNSADAIDLLQTKGIVEYGGFTNNCTGVSKSAICALLSALEKYYDDKPHPQNLNTNTRIELIDRILDLSIVISCDSKGNMVIAGVEKWLEYAEIAGYFPQALVPAQPLEVTTTTTIVE